MAVRYSHPPAQRNTAPHDGQGDAPNRAPNRHAVDQVADLLSLMMSLVPDEAEAPAPAVSAPEVNPTIELTPSPLIAVPS